MKQAIIEALTNGASLTQALADVGLTYDEVRRMRFADDWFDRQLIDASDGRVRPIEARQRRHRTVRRERPVLPPLVLPPPHQETLSVAETAAVLGVGPDTVLRWTREGLLECELTGKKGRGSRRYKHTDVRALRRRLDEQSQRPGARFAPRRSGRPLLAAGAGFDHPR